MIVPHGDEICTFLNDSVRSLVRHKESLVRFGPFKVEKRLIILLHGGQKRKVCIDILRCFEGKLG